MKLRALLVATTILLSPYASPATVAHVNDGAIQKSVTYELKRHPEFLKTKIKVESKGAIVFLSGFVQTLEQKRDASLIVSQVKGVHAVQNNLA